MTLAAGGSFVAGLRACSGIAADGLRVGHPVCCSAPSTMEPCGGPDAAVAELQPTSVGSAVTVTAVPSGNAVIPAPGSRLRPPEQVRHGSLNEPSGRTDACPRVGVGGHGECEL